LTSGTGTYGYDEIGNLTADSKAGITAIDWNVYGKIRSITKTNPISYAYDPSGNRISKTVVTPSGSQVTWYVRDAQGNQLAVYDNVETAIKWKEQDLYGSSRLGMWKPNFKLAVDSGAAAWTASGLKFFELSNHLGNVMAVINDNRIPVSGGYEPVVINANDYYAFGSQMVGRSFVESNAIYRYGFNGKENDNEVKGEGNQQDYGMRIYDPRIGRFLSVDPIGNSFPWWTPYQFAGNTPILATDLDGLEIFIAEPIAIPMEPLMPRMALPRLALPRVTIPRPPGEIALPPISSNLPNRLTVGQRKVDASAEQPKEIDWTDPPSSPDDLGSEWKEITSSKNKTGNYRQFENENNGDKVQFDKGKPGEPGFEGKDHWHRFNPKSKGDFDKYLDKFGNPVKKGGNPSHIEAPKPILLQEIIIKPEKPGFFERMWNGIKEFFKPEPPDPRDDPNYA
jgi:RHS repeat-associated protein